VATPTSQDQIDHALMDEEGVLEEDLAIPGVLPLRRRCARHLRREVAFVWVYRDWTWRQTARPNATLTVPAGVGYVSLGTLTDFLGFGRSMSPQLASQPNFPPLAWVPAATMNYLFDVEQRQGTPNRFSILSQDPLTGDQYLYIYPIPTADTLLTIPSERLPPAIVDYGDPAAPGTGDELFLIPEPWVTVVVYEGLVLRLLKDKGSADVAEQRNQYILQLKNMVVENRPGRMAPHRIVPYGVSMSGRIR